MKLFAPRSWSWKGALSTDGNGIAGTLRSNTDAKEGHDHSNSNSNSQINTRGNNNNNSNITYAMMTAMQQELAEMRGKHTQLTGEVATLTGVVHTMNERIAALDHVVLRGLGIAKGSNEYVAEPSSISMAMGTEEKMMASCDNTSTVLTKSTKKNKQKKNKKKNGEDPLSMLAVLKTILTRGRKICSSNNATVLFGLMFLYCGCKLGQSIGNQGENGGISKSSPSSNMMDKQKHSSIPTPSHPGVRENVPTTPNTSNTYVRKRLAPILNPNDLPASSSFGPPSTRTHKTEKKTFDNSVNSHITEPSSTSTIHTQRQLDLDDITSNNLRLTSSSSATAPVSSSIRVDTDTEHHESPHTTGTAEEVLHYYPDWSLTKCVSNPVTEPINYNELFATVEECCELW